MSRLKMLDSETYTAAFQKSLKSTIRFLSMRGANEDKATDLAMDAWTNAWEKRALYDASKGAVITWVTRIAWRLMRRNTQRFRPRMAIACEHFVDDPERIPGLERRLLANSTKKSKWRGK
jgi:DNA-directed RNA polymerase specialized sigma24 family protein